MREHKITIYKFDELSKEAQETAVNKWNETTDHVPLLKEQFVNRLKELNYPTDDIAFRLSYSQGDGVAFYGYMDNDDIKNILNRLDLTEKENNLYALIQDNDFQICGTISRNSFGHRYSHENTMDFEVTPYSDNIDTIIEEVFSLHIEDDEEEYNKKFNEIEKLYNKITSLILDDIQKISRELEKEGYQIIEDQESFDQVADLLRANEYEFYKDGKIF
ncbi:hypothetical protein [Bacillus mojavensis]